ncbi:hypothetical protein MAP00_004033 [Monascus purpureus]|nr:hypothetical protein MAP00_004033 [Monascus purpureus]
MPVNANWGITKAGKPRKRLAQACLTCREKKIKCQPNLPRCDQCQKSGRDCRFENAPRGHRAVKVSHQAGQTSRSDAKDSRSSFSNSHSVPPNPFHSVNRTSNSPTSIPSGPSPISESSIFTSSAPDGVHEGAPDGEIGHKAGLKGSNRSSLELPQHQVESIGSYASPDFAELLMEVKHLDRDDPLTCDWNTDPYEADPELTTHYIETYFNYVNDTLYYMLPRGRFFLWLNSSRTKSLADKMLLYSMMTLGSVFSNRPDKLTALKRYSRTARYAIEHSQHLFTLQLAQSRIILSLWYYAIGALVKSWDSIGGAVRTVCGLCYNIESGGVTAGQTQVCEYGLHPQALLECRRRTFWVAFLVERLTTLYAPSSVFIPSQTALLRLPCREDIYEAQEYGTVPYFQDFLNKEASSIKEGDVSGLSFMAFLISIVTLWSDVSQHIFYSPHIPADAYARIFKEFHTTIVWRAGEWTMKLPENLTFTTENLERSIRMRKGDAFISVHLLYHVTLMKLNRYVRYRNLPSGTVDQYIHNAQHHAAEILRICVSLARCTADHRSRPARSSHSEPFLSLKAAHLNPFLGYIILTAVDAVSAAGLMTDLRDCIALLQGGLDTIKELGHYWGSSLQLASHIEARIDLMADCLRHDTGKAGWILDGTPLHTRVRVGNAAQRQNPTGGAINQDLLYGGLPRERLFRALGLPGVSEDDILCISDGSHDSPVLSSNGLK